MRVSRASGTLEFPADFLLVACANPCPCGRGDEGVPVRRRAADALRAPAVGAAARSLRPAPRGSRRPAPRSASRRPEIRGRVEVAVERQRSRLAGTRWRRNAHIPAGALERLVPLAADAREAWVDACRLRRLTGRGAARIRRVARTLADLDDRDAMTADDIDRARRGCERTSGEHRPTRRRRGDARVAPARSRAPRLRRHARRVRRSDRRARGGARRPGDAATSGGATSIDPSALARAVARARRVAPRSACSSQARDTHVWIAGDDDYPIPDPLPNRPPRAARRRRPARRVRRAPRVAIVGTRSATPHGLADARELGAFLAGAGVTVVSGLAIGIDGAAHEGALDAGGLAVGVVATGLDVVYPRRHRALYDAGARARARRRRARLRRAAVAVSASRSATASSPRWPTSSWSSRPPRPGGARITAGDAAEYGRDVYALPGLAPEPGRGRLQRADRRRRRAAPRSRRPAVRARPGREPARAAGAPTERTRPSDRDEAAVLHALGGDPATIDELERNTRRSARPAWARR